MDTRTELAPFRVEIDEAAVADLRHRLARTRWPDQLADSAWALGTDVAYLRDLCEHWASGFDFGAFAARYNAHPRSVLMSTTRRCTRSSPRPTPPRLLLLLQGWPSTVAEYRDVIEPVCARHHVVASLPGYGFSGPTTSARCSRVPSA